MPMRIEVLDNDLRCTVSAEAPVVARGTSGGDAFMAPWQANGMAAHAHVYGRLSEHGHGNQAAQAGLPFVSDIGMGMSAWRGSVQAHVFLMQVWSAVKYLLLHVRALALLLTLQAPVATTTCLQCVIRHTAST